MPTMIAPGHWFECFSDTRFIPWQDAAREAVAALTDRADLIVALYHRDAPAPDEPALAGVDLVLRGHSHVAPEHLERCGAAWCSRVGAFGSHARLIGITMPDRTVSLDRLIDLRAPETADG
jgi:2',3'-cyclic-nucleotide 2'-phosphodiesterase (5'-nucleotidase family)